MTVPTKLEADNWVSSLKIVTAEVKWVVKLGGRWCLEAVVFSPEYQELFKLHAQAGKRNYSFALLYQNYPIRKYTKHGRHTLPDGTVLTVPHKHIWDEDNHDGDAYIPNDIDPQSDINEQFLAFCAECNIVLEGGYQHIIHIWE